MSRVDTKQASRSRVAGSWTLLDFDRELAIVDNWEDLEAALRSLPERASSPNAIATLATPRGDTLSIGIAGQGDRDNPELNTPLASVEYNGAAGDPPYLVPVADPTLPVEERGIVVFRFEGQWTEIPRRNCVPVDVMLRIAKDFFSTGNLPGWISWEEV
jgi:Immunity protein Imm1